MVNETHATGKINLLIMPIYLMVKQFYGARQWRIPEFWNSFSRVSAALICAVCFNSCVPIEKLTYLQTDDEIKNETISYTSENYRLQMGDILDVRISSLNPEVNDIFNASVLGTMQVAQANAQTGGDIFFLTGYGIDEKGEIDIPFIGPVEVAGLTLDEAYAKIDSKVSEMFTNYHLQLKLGGVRFSVLGEFNRPGKYVIMQNRATIFEAIALGGDLNNVANREELVLIRQYPEGTKVHRINLLDQSVIGSEFYFVQPNDAFYAEPLPQRSWGVGITGAQTLSTIVGTLSTSLALLLSIISLNQ